MSDQPIQMSWDGEVLRPTSTFWTNRAKEMWGDGEILMIEARMERSDASHRHYFAAVKEAWDNLPDDKREQYPSPEHLRSWALIKAGFCDRRDMVCVAPSAARELVAYIRPLDTYAVVLAREGVVSTYTAKSQSYKAMGEEEFAKSKDAVLDVLAKLLGVTVDDLKKAEAA